jgi:hypothetical protein
LGSWVLNLFDADHYQKNLQPLTPSETWTHNGLENQQEIAINTNQSDIDLSHYEINAAAQQPVAEQQQPSLEQ